MPVTFDTAATYNSSRKAVEVTARSGGASIICRIPSEVLCDDYECQSNTRADLLRTFEAHRKDIERRAERLILGAQFEEDGSIKIRSPLPPQSNR